jgi:hypothetical protein
LLVDASRSSKTGATAENVTTIGAILRELDGASKRSEKTQAGHGGKTEEKQGNTLENSIKKSWSLPAD